MINTAFSLCFCCIRRGRRHQPVRQSRPLKPPKLQRSEARERLESVAEVSNVTGNQKAAYVGETEEEARPYNVSTLEKEW